MKTVYFITHPDVVIDPEVPAPQWPLSPRGKERIHSMLRQPWVDSIGAVYCSSEQKAVDGAQILADYLGIGYHIHDALGEIDRSSTGFLPEDAFWPVVNQLYANPNESSHGWETGAAAQQRIRDAVDTVVGRDDGDDNIAIIAHGMVGALYLGYLKEAPISRALEQPETNGGNYYAFRIETEALLHEWQPIDTSQKDDINLRHCPNIDCRFLADTGMIAEFKDDVEQCPDCGTALIAGAAPPPPKRNDVGQSRLWKASELLSTVGTFESEDEAYEGKEELNSSGIMSIVIEAEMPVIEGDDLEAGGDGDESSIKKMVPEKMASEKMTSVFALQVARFDLRRAYEILGVPAEPAYQIDEDYWDELEKAGLYGDSDDDEFDAELDDDAPDDGRTEMSTKRDADGMAHADGDGNPMMKVVGVVLLVVIVGLLYMFFR